MKLANTNGGNKGKKYIKLTGNEKITDERIAEVLKFTQWFNDNCGKVKDSITTKEPIDPEIFSETYISIYEAIAFKNLNTKDYKAYFSRAYYTNKIASQAKEARHNAKHYDIEQSWHVADESIDQENMAKEAEKLNIDILDYVKQSYDPLGYSLFQTYIHSKPSISYKALSELTKIPQHRVSKILSTILKDVRTTFRQQKEAIIG